MVKLDIFGKVENLKTTLRSKFIVPPFSVLDARQEYWQRRKRQWIKLGIEGEEGRDKKLLGSRLGYEVMEKNDGSIRKQQGTSIFDPVLTELMYRWFCPDNGKILDPFAGGSVRGIVANLLDYNYTGIELRNEQIVANVEQGHKILSDNIPEWICGDSCEVCSLIKKTKRFDFVFSCPPYYNLEVYSDLKGELSNYKSYKKFLHYYRIIIAQCLSLLKDNRFACFVVSNIRNKDGFYLNFCNDTIDAFQKSGVYFYNEIILVTAIGSLPIRVGKQFKSGRKIGKTHQNILVFYKGNPKNIKKHFSQEFNTELNTRRK